MHWLQHITGLDTQNGTPYMFWSGVGMGMLTVISWMSCLTLYYRRHNCHHHLCPFLGHYQAGPYRVCRRHHPDVPKRITKEHVQFAINQSKEVNK